MAQCGGISVQELAKLELELCERLGWRLIPTIDDLQQIRDARSRPTSEYWAGWTNSPPRSPTGGEPAASSSDEEEGARSPAEQTGGQLPHAKSHQDVKDTSLMARLFRPASAVNIAAWGAGKGHEAAAAGGKGETDSTSPRTVVSRNFSLSNLLGLTRS